MERQLLAVVPDDFSAVMRERMAVLLDMGKHHLDLEWVHTFSLPDISACCKRMEDHLGKVWTYSSELQRELIQNPAFAAYYAEFLESLPEDPPEETEPAPVTPYRSGNRYGYSRPSPAKAYSRRETLKVRLAALLKSCRTAGFDITTAPVDELMAALEIDRLDDNRRLDYLRNFAPMKLLDSERDIAVAGILNCVDLPTELSGEQKALLLKQAAGDRELFASAPFEEVSGLLASYPLLENIAEFLTEMEINDCLTLEDYRRFSQNVPEYHRLILSILGCMDQWTANAFMRFWRQSGYPLGELQTMEQRLAADMELDLEEVFSSYAGYVNLLYGKRFQSIDFSDVTGYREGILLHAIVKNKKHFIRMVDNNPEAFLSIPSTSILFNTALYQEHLNINELTEKDLKDCAWMISSHLQVNCLTPGRVYTFQELRTLYDAGGKYVSLYNKLASPRQDYRLLVIRQFLKRKLLNDAVDDTALDGLAEKLDEKPLDRWMQEDFKGIRGLKAGDTVQLLIHLEDVGHLLPMLERREDAILALRNAGQLARFSTVSALKAHITDTDADWKSLSENMELTGDFKAMYEERIAWFICGNGAYIANQYMMGIGAQQQEAFLRVVKAELMGKLDTLKYFEGDLQRELDLDISEQTAACWKENTGLSQKGIEVREYDDFFSTMLLGLQPQRTCLAYDMGIYKNCLLSGFDSNKKVLYAEVDGECAGRAYLRLTKGRMGRSEDGAEAPFTFVDVENIHTQQAERAPSSERLVLFLERPYFGGVNGETEVRICNLMIALAERKADALSAVLVLSNDYRGTCLDGFAFTKFNIYISKTKAGAQYLDSLGGQATVDTEGCYKSNTFLVRSSDLPA